MHGNSLKTLRQDLLARRKSFAADLSYSTSLNKLSSKLYEFLNQIQPESVALFIPIQDEPDLRPILINWASQSSTRKLALPFARPDKHLDFYIWQETDLLITSKHGIPEPDPNNPQRGQITPDCILMPCVGWSKSSENNQNYYWRLGYGGGYFDRTLAFLRKTNPRLACVGIGFDWQILNDAQWQNQTHDEPLDYLLTDSGIQS